MALAKLARRAIVFDLDKTLLNTDRIKEYQEAAIQTHGISPRIFRKTYEDSHLMLDSEYPYWHASAMAREYTGHESPTLTDKICRTMMRELQIHARDLVFVDAARCLYELNKSGEDIIILTRGSWLYQRFKVECSGLLEYATDVVIVKDTKYQAVLDILDLYEFVIFVDNDWNELEDISTGIGIHSAFQALKRCQKGGILAGQCIHIDRYGEAEADQTPNLFIKRVSELDASFLLSLTPMVVEGGDDEKA